MTTKQLIGVLVGLIELGYNNIKKQENSIIVRGGGVPDREFTVSHDVLDSIPDHGNIFQMLVFDFGFETFDYAGELVENPHTYFTIEHKPNRLQARKVDTEEYLVTMNGIVKTNKGDYVITGVNGEKYPCDPEIFKQLYNIVS